MLESEAYCHSSDPEKYVAYNSREHVVLIIRQEAPLFCDGVRSHSMRERSHVVRRRGQFWFSLSFRANVNRRDVKDLSAALGHTRHGNAIASRHRKPVASLTSRLAGYVVGSLNTTGVGFVRTMTAVELHAELVYAESLFEKVR